MSLELNYMKLVAAEMKLKKAERLWQNDHWRRSQVIKITASDSGG
jgi:hypothetical protein